MPNLLKTPFLAELARRYGPARKLKGSESLFDVADGTVRVYIRYSKVHPRNRTFFGLRETDIRALTGTRGIICFLWDGQREPLLVPLREFEEVFAGLTPASDGQFKAQVYESKVGTELYIANAGRFGVERFLGWSVLDESVYAKQIACPTLSHVQVQTLLGGIGAAKGFDVWIPSVDRETLDWNLTREFSILGRLPDALASVNGIAACVDVIWLLRGGGVPTALYEVEHSTPIYSGLLRFNDVHLILPTLSVRFGIVSNEGRRDLFARQLQRPTFKASGLFDICTFHEYDDVYAWHERLQKGAT
jgi:hypothetical protein